MRRLVLALVCLTWTSTLLWADDAIPLKTLTELKSATVFIKVQAGRDKWSGSGFVAKVEGDTGYIVTNHHVALGKSKSPVPAVKPDITLVFWSGARNERSSRAEILASDPERDLAILKVTGFKDLPRPIDISQKPALVETMPVYVFGFPFGQALATSNGNPNITVGKGAVSSVRTNEYDEVTVVQIDGALNPGNSGGPVVDARGRLVGVAVATIKGSGIGFSIPPRALTEMLDGCIGAKILTTRKADRDMVEVKVLLHLIDPMDKIKQVTFTYVTGTDVKEGRAELAKLSGVKQLALKVDNHTATGNFLLPAPSKGKDRITWQASFVNGAGKNMLTLARAYRLDPSAPTEPPIIARPPSRDPKPLGEKGLDGALADLKSTDAFRRKAAAEQLARTEVNPQHREAIARALQSALDDPDRFTRQAVIRALGKWGGKDNVPELMKLLTTSDVFTRRMVCETLGQLKDLRAADPLAERFADFHTRAAAAAALKILGPAAEAAVLKALSKSDVSVKREAVDILRVIGTSKSVPALEALASSRDFHISRRVAPLAREALAAIAERAKTVKQ